MGIEQIRAQYPQYDDLSDMELARALHSRFYSDMEFGDFAGQIGLNPNAVGSMVGETAPAIPDGNALGDFLATFGNSAGLGIPRAISNTFGSGELDARLDFLEGNAPASANIASNLAGATLTGGLAGRAGLRALANSGRIPTAANPHALRIAHQATPGLARTAGRGLLDLVKSKAGIGGGGLVGGALLERLLRG